MKSLMFCLLTAGFMAFCTPAHAGMLSVAESVEGLHERANRGQLKQILGIDPARTPWCGYAMAYFARKAGLELPDGYGKARSWTRAGRKVSKPERGDVVVLNRHVGLFTRFEGNRICLLGGNQSNRIAESCYPRRSVVAYRRLGTPARSGKTATPVFERVLNFASER